MFFCSYFCVICVLFFFCRKFQICFIHQTKKIVSPEKISIFIDNQLGRRSTAKIERGLGTERARLTKIESDLCIERARYALLEALVLNVQDQALLEALAQNVQNQASMGRQVVILSENFKILIKSVYSCTFCAKASKSAQSCKFCAQASLNLRRRQQMPYISPK